jgi:hypothetical protein
MPGKLEKVSKDSKVVNENRTFFCSELIAKAYKIFGIYNSKRS